jgi:hypothetical protein
MYKCTHFYSRKGTWGLPPPVKLERRDMTYTVSMWRKTQNKNKTIKNTFIQVRVPKKGYGLTWNTWLSQTISHLSVKSMQTLDSSVNRTCLQCCMVDRICTMVYSKRAWRCRRVKGIRMQGLLHHKLPSCSLLRTVCVETQIPAALARPFRREVQCFKVTNAIMFIIRNWNSNYSNMNMKYNTIRYNNITFVY